MITSSEDTSDSKIKKKFYFRLNEKFNPPKINNYSIFHFIDFGENEYIFN